MRVKSAGGLLVAALILAAYPSYGQVPSNILLRTLLIQTQPSVAGTAFTIDVDGRQYLITAKHVVAKLPDAASSTIQVRKKNGWSPLKVTVFKCDDPVDIAVLVPPSQVTVNFPLEPTSAGMLVGQDAYFVGFPYGNAFATTYTNQPNVFGFVKRATVSQFDRIPENANAQIILLDGYNNPGFSGSAVVYRDLNQSGLAFKVAGVLVSYVYDAAPVVNKKQEIHESEITAEDREKDDVVRTITDGRLYRVEDTKQLVKLNSGIATAWDIGSAIDLIHQHPIGPKVDANWKDQ
jgi:hypothetical protein